MIYKSYPNTHQLNLKVNGENHQLQISPWTTLLDALRQRLGLTGTKKGCDHGQCGACTVIVDSVHINSCLSLAIMNEDKEIITIEGLAKDGELHLVQKAFIEEDAFQCGYCTSGQICSTIGLLNMNDGASPEEIRDLMSGNICRCGAYTNIYRVVKDMITNNIKGTETAIEKNTINHE